jgi:hypothetical protein
MLMHPFDDTQTHVQTRVCSHAQVVQQFVDMDQVATALALSPSGYLITIGTDDRLVKVIDYDEVCVSSPSQPFSAF